MEDNQTIVLVNIKSPYTAENYAAPLGILYVGGTLKKSGFGVNVYHIASDEIDSIVEEVVAAKPLFIGFSTLTGKTIRGTTDMSKEIKKRAPSIPIVWGGVHPSLLPQQCLANEFIDFVIIGEGEVTAVELARALAKENNFERIKGIGYKNNGKIFINPARELIQDIDSYRIDWSLIDFNKVVYYNYGKKSINYVTSRGCPFACNFCYNEVFNKRKWRGHSLGHVLEGLKELKQHGIQAVHFNDDELFINMERVLEILKYLKELNIELLNCNVRLDSLNDNILQKLVDQNARRVFVGWESGCDRVLSLIGKKITKAEIIEKFKMLARYPELKVSAGGIIGIPTETWEETQETIDFAIKLVDIVPATSLNLGTYIPFPGTKLYELALKNGFKPPVDLVDWAQFDIYHGKVNLSWIKWADSQQQRIFILIDKYAKLLERSKSDNLVKTVGKHVMHYIAKFRLKKRFFLFPLEIYLFYKLKGWSSELLTG